MTDAKLRPADSAGIAVEAHDRIDPWHVAALHAALNRDGPAPAEGEALPPLWHWMFFRRIARGDELGPDGHPSAGGLIPDFGLPRRMWAGGRLEFPGRLVVGEEARLVSVVQNVALKEGGSGTLTIATLRHEIHGPDGLAIREEQDIVYRPAASPDDPPPKTPPLKDERPAWIREITADPALLFRYSALTYNSHRIHYDLPHATGTEGYAGLLVHGPLMAQLLADLARDEGRRPLARFHFRAVSPVFHNRPFAACGRGFGDKAELWIRNDEGRLAMSAEATFG